MLDPTRYRRASEIFDRAMALKPATRMEYIEQAADGDDELAAQLDRMIRYAERSEDEQPFARNVMIEDDRSDDELPAATLVGRYRIACAIGEGGFGSVYRAEQEHPVRRMVALKILKRGMDSRAVIRRFEGERQALAVMEHPCIAQVFDAGETDAELGARPYFVMELVQGEPITEYCDRHSLGITQRLELFITVCRAVQHAHQKGIIHRDLKPSNILVADIDGEALPKIIDFGIAKAIQKPFGVDANQTNRMELIGTPQYMSPEQADADDCAIDIRTDVYSLGVMLHELLVGSTPLDPTTLSGLSYSRMIRAIMEQRNERPSNRLQHADEEVDAIARVRATDMRSLRRRLQGDLDWITLKAIDRDRERRYDSATALAGDLRRHLKHEPVQAGSPPALYRMQKFVRRHRVGASAAAAVFLALAVGAVMATAGMVDARRSAEQALQVNTFMSDVLTRIDPSRPGADVRFVDVLGDASATAGVRFAGHPELEAEVRTLLGKVYFNLSMWSQAVEELQRADELWRGVLGEDDPKSLHARLTYGRALGNQNRNREAQAVMVELLPRIERVLGEDDAMALHARRSIAMSKLFLRQPDEAEAEMRQLLRDCERADADDETRILVLDGLVRVLRHRMLAGEQYRAELELRAAELAEDCAEAFGQDSLQALSARLAQARAIESRHDYTTAGAIAVDVLTTSQARLGECHDLCLEAGDILAIALYREGRVTKAADLQLHEIDCVRSKGTPIVLVSVIYTSLPLMDYGGRHAEGEAMAREGSTILAGFGGGHGAMMIGSDMYIARFVSLQGRLDEADDLFAALLARESETASEPVVAAQLHMFYAGHLVALGRYEEAEEHLQQAVAIQGDADHGTWEFAPDDLLIELIRLYEAWDKPEPAAHYRMRRDKVLSGSS